MYVPGYYAFLLEESGIPPNNILYPLFSHVLYTSQLQQGIFYLDGFTVFFNNVCHYIQDQNIPMSRNALLPYVKHFWNRQFVIQMIMIPTKLSFHNISIPLHRHSSSFNIQADIMYLRTIEYQQGFKYLVVILETYSRFLWVKPIKRIREQEVSHAIQQAFQRPGIANAFYTFLRDKVHEITVDGGSEFRADFPRTIHGLFSNHNQNSTIVTAKPKLSSFGRPDRTGPVEAGNRMLRKVIRDYSIGINRQFIKNSINDDGFGPLLDTYNNHIQIQTLHNHSPKQVVEALLTGNRDHQLITLLDTQFQKRKEKRVTIQQSIQNDYPIITDTKMGYAYRLILPRSPFPKQVDFRMSVQLYYITHYDSQRVNLRHYYFADQELQDISWKRLVLVKVPIDFGPTGTGANSMVARVLAMQTNDRQFVP